MDVLALERLRGLLNGLLTLGKDHLDVARVGHVRVDTTVGTVCAAALLGGLVDLDVLDDQVGGVETLGVGVGFGVLEEIEEELGGLDGPAGLGDTEWLAWRRNVSFCLAPRCISLLPIFCPSRVTVWITRTLRSPSGRSSVSPHGDGLLVLLDMLEVDESPLQLETVDRLGSLPGVLVGHPQI